MHVKLLLNITTVISCALACTPKESSLSEVSRLAPSETQIVPQIVPQTVAQAERSNWEERLDGKADQDKAFPLFQDLAIVIPKEYDGFKALEILPTEWLNVVDEALAESEIGESISDESWPEDWQLVSLRISPCSPLGQVADREEIDRLCWPGVRFVFQPIIKQLQHLSVIKDYYADDRAIHALYRLAPKTESLKSMQAKLGQGLRLSDITPEELAEFEAQRDEQAKWLLEQVYALRQAHLLDADHLDYSRPDERFEYFYEASTEAFNRQLLNRILLPIAQPENLHELTAFSLPLGRNPVSAELWSFVGFHQEGGVLVQNNLHIRGAHSGALLYEFKGEGALKSEDVTTAEGDTQFLDDLEALPNEIQSELRQQVVINPREESAVKAKIADPYQTLVSHTSCSSCHRDNNLQFNFHNFSYFEEQDISIAPRTINDVQRDIAWSLALIAR